MTLDQRARDAATTMREKLDAIAIPEPAAVLRRARRRRLGRGALAIVAVASAVAIIAGVAGSGSANRIEVSGQKGQAPPTNIARVPSRTSIPEAALQQMRVALLVWATFPAHASPRPLVLTSDPVSAPDGGFRTVDDKEAFLSGAFVAPATLPSGPQNADGYPVTSAAQALAVMRAEGSPAGGSVRPPSPLVITAIRFGTSSFETDRGTRLLPAWLFSFQGAEDPAAVLAVAPSSRFPVPVDSFASTGARLGPDDRTATITFVGAAPGRGPCTSDYAVDQLASDTAVAIRVRETSSRGGTCRLVGYARHVAIALASPLGGRVLVDATTKAAVAVAP